MNKKKKKYMLRQDISKINLRGDTEHNCFHTVEYSTNSTWDSALCVKKGQT